MADNRVVRRVPAGVTIRTVEGEDGVYQEVRAGDKVYRVEGQALPHVQVKGLIKRKVVSINSHPIEGCPCSTVRKVRRGFSVFHMACPDCGHRDGWFLLGVLTGVALTVGTLVVAAKSQPSNAQASARRPARKSLLGRLVE